MRPINVAVVGDRQVGKTCFIQRQLKGRFDSEYRPTLDIHVEPLSFSTNYGQVTFRMWDTTNRMTSDQTEERMNPIDAVIAMYDVTRNATYSMAAKWVQQWKKRPAGVGRKDVFIVVCGNKTDMRKNMAHARHGGNAGVPFHFMISVINNDNTLSPLIEIARSLYSKPDLAFDPPVVLEEGVADDFYGLRPVAAAAACSSRLDAGDPFWDASLSTAHKANAQFGASQLIECAISYAYPIVSSRSKGWRDWSHVERVVSNACNIMGQLRGSVNGVPFDRELVLAGCILHDVAGNAARHDEPGNAARHDDLSRFQRKIDAARRCVEFLTQHGHLAREHDVRDACRRDRIAGIIVWTSFSTTRHAIRCGMRVPCFAELAIVRDADRLDAIGAVGITRAAMAGGLDGATVVPTRMPPLTDWDGHIARAAACTSKDGSVFTRYYAKLFHLPFTLSTWPARRMAHKRVVLMVAYMNGLIEECQLVSPIRVSPVASRAATATNVNMANAVGLCYGKSITAAAATTTTTTTTTKNNNNNNDSIAGIADNKNILIDTNSASNTSRSVERSVFDETPQGGTSRSDVGIHLTEDSEFGYDDRIPGDDSGGKGGGD